MKRLRASLLVAGLALVASAFAIPPRAQQPSGREIVKRVERLLWAGTTQGEFEMSVVTPRWSRTLSLRMWMERPTRSFVRILAPAKEAGIGSQRIGAEMWNYLPKVERTIKIQPSMMLRPRMGSDFTNDDLVKASNAVNDYGQEVLRVEPVDGAPAYVIEAVRKPEAAVVRGRIVYWVRMADFIPLKHEYYSERGELVRVMSFSDVRPIGGRVVPTRWEMRPLAKLGNVTVIVLKSARYDQPIDPEVFTQRNLQKP